MKTERNRLYGIWRHMIDRTTNPKHESYKNYGGKGVTVCPEWFDSFEAFYEWAMKNGYQDDLTIDRIDNNGNYEPSNCRWADWNTQANNRSYCVNITYKGETHTLMQWCKILNLHYPAIRSRIVDYGWSIDKAFETPVKVFKPSTGEKRIRIPREQYLLQEHQKTQIQLERYIKLKEEQPQLSVRAAAKQLGLSKSYVQNLKELSKL